VAHEESVEEKQKRSRENKGFLDLVQRHCQIVPVIELAFADPEKRDSYERVFGRYGAEAMLLASKPGTALWTDDLMESEMAAHEFGIKRVWTQVVLSFVTSLGLLEAKERDVATAKLISNGIQRHFFLIVPRLLKLSIFAKPYPGGNLSRASFESSPHRTPT
jgi:hypothetical protein